MWGSTKDRNGWNEENTNRDGWNIENWMKGFTKVLRVFSSPMNHTEVSRERLVDMKVLAYTGGVGGFKGIWAFGIHGQGEVSGHEVEEDNESNNLNNWLSGNYWIL